MYRILCDNLRKGYLYIEPLMEKKFLATELLKDEIKMFTMYSKGKKIKEIAKKFHLSPATISEKMDKVAQKLNVENKIAATCKLIKTNLI